MTELTKYVCDVCGATYEDKELCRKHEDSHKIGKLLDIKGAKFYANGKQASDYKFESLDAFLTAIDAIEVSNSNVAETINSLYLGRDYFKPFENLDSRRVYFDVRFAEWVDADETIKIINSNFGEE